MSAGDWKEMYLAATRGDLELVKYHIKNGVNPNYQHPEILSTVLVASIVGGYTEMARFLLENGADPTLLSEFDGLTPLQAARLHQRQEVLELLNPLLPKRSFFRRLFK